MWHFTLLVTLLFASLTVQAQEAPWRGQLQDGSQIVIDPETNKVTRKWQGESTMLWDGVHQLDNGAVIIVRDGTVVKDRAVMKMQQEAERRRMEEACLTLVRKVCGPRNECEDDPACGPARQLLSLEQDERLKGWGDSVTESSRKCMEAMNNESFFRSCTKRSAGTPLTPCERLQKRVCGEHDECGSSEACDAADQLVKMEREDRYASPQGFSESSEQCKSVPLDDNFFVSCRPSSK